LVFFGHEVAETGGLFDFWGDGVVGVSGDRKSWFNGRDLCGEVIDNGRLEYDNGAGDRLDGND
jgi:hypothetical protein